MPSTKTLKKYGLTIEDYNKIGESQNWLCAICGLLKPLVIDHYHVKGFKRMQPEKRKIFVRGLLCIYCNLRLLPKGMDLDKARKLVSYLERFNKTLIKKPT
jgi:hypothetical protein